MAGFSIILIFVILFTICYIIFNAIGMIGVAMFIAAVALTIAFIATRNDRKVKGKNLGWKISIPVILYAISIPTIIIYVLINIFFFIYVVTASDTNKYDGNYHNNGIYDYSNRSTNTNRNRNINTNNSYLNTHNTQI